MLDQGRTYFSVQSAALLSALANSKRVEIISYLLEGEMSVNDIAERVSLSQSALSQHLAKLRNMDLVQTRRDRQMIFYSCNTPAVRKVYDTLQELFHNTASRRS